MRIKLLAYAQFCAALGSIFLFSTLAVAQYSGNVQGFVLDPSGAAVAGASVILHNVDTGIENNTKTSESGNYRFSSLPPGNYWFPLSRVASRGRKWLSFLAPARRKA